MKNILILFLVAITILIATTPVKAANNEPRIFTWKSYTPEEVKGMTLDQQKARVFQIKARMAEIKAMDKSNLTHEQKSELRSEQKSMRTEAKAMDPAAGGKDIYLPIGAVLISAILLVLILS